jgi:L-lactate dehydrogenase complex protein LldG
MSGRDEILARVRAAVATAPGEPHISRAYRVRSDIAAGDPQLVGLLVDRLEDYAAHTHQSDDARIPDTVAAILAAETGRPRVAVPSDLPKRWLPASVEPLTDDGLTIDQLESLDGVITAATVAIAETGTIVLDGSPDQGRRVLTLLPDLHICVVRVDQIVATVPEAITRLVADRPLTWISGPSATSDIELSRVEGVHGPRTLHVVIVNDDVPDPIRRSAP